MDSLFPKMPKDITALGNDELDAAIAEHMVAVEKINADDAEYLSGYSADEVLAELELGVGQVNALKAEKEGRVEAQENYATRKAELIAPITAPKAEEAPEEEDGDTDAEPDEEAAEVTAVAETEGEDGDDGDKPAEVAETRELVTAASVTTSNATEANATVRMLRPPAPAADRVVVNEPETKQFQFVASGFLPQTPPGSELPTSHDVALALIEKGKSMGSPTHGPGGIEEFQQVAKLDYSAMFDEDHTLRYKAETSNSEKIRKAGSPFAGDEAFAALTASGGLCAPSENIYSMPNLASNARPVRDALPSFRAERGAINVPVPTTIGDAAGAITVITAAEDGLGGTFATKACLDLDCPDFNETAVTVIAHCREFGNLNAFSWPEKIAHENEITMAEHARVSEGFLLGQIKAQSVHVSSGAETLSALTYLVDAITKTKFGIRSRLRMPNEARFVALLPRVVLDILQLDTVQKQFDSYRSQGEIEGYLDSIGVDVTWYMDTPLLSNGVGTDGPSMIADAAQGDQAALEAFPDTIQWAMFPAGTFLHIDMAELNLGIVRDSTLNATNDFQIFGETFENVARIGPPQAAYWETTDICATGQYPPLGTARTCD